MAVTAQPCAHQLCLKLGADLGRCELNPDLFYCVGSLFAGIFLMADTHLCQMVLGNSSEESFGIRAYTHCSTEPSKKGGVVFKLFFKHRKIEGMSWMLANLFPITNVHFHVFCKKGGRGINIPIFLL